MILGNGYKQENKDKSDNSDDFNSMLKEKERKLKEKSKVKPKIKDTQGIYEKEIQKTIESKARIMKQLDRTEENIEHDER